METPYQRDQNIAIAVDSLCVDLDLIDHPAGTLFYLVAVGDTSAELGPNDIAFVLRRAITHHGIECSSTYLGKHPGKVTGME
jgi:hypothetical protein